MAKHRRRRRLIIPALLLAVFLLFWRSNTALQVTETTMVFPDLPTGFSGCRIAVLGDTHGAEFGPGNQDLFSAIAEAEPDYIVHVGDLEDSYRGPEPGYPESLADGLTAIAPTYYVTGNHEWAIGGVPELKSRLTEHGVQVLSNQYVTLTRNGSSLILAGIDDPNGYADQKSPEALAAELSADLGDPFWILLAHRNNRFEHQYSLLGADLVISGHGHGGIIRLPFTDGLIDADRSLFPTCTAGDYYCSGSALFVTRGLGNSGVSLRLFNRPEIAMLTLKKAD